MKNARVAIVQMLNEPGAIASNVGKMLDWARRAVRAGAEFVFFPEGSLTGYAIERASDIAVGADCEEAQVLDRFAAERGIAIGYGLVERRGKGKAPFDTYVIASGDGRLAYRKAHLGESERPAFFQGDDLPVACVNGVRVGVQLCWESHIGDIATTLRAKGAELLVSPHAVGIGGDRRLELWNRYMPARAMDNGLFVVACNALRPGSRDEGAQRGEAESAKGGGLAAYGPDGAVLEAYAGSSEHLMAVQIGGSLPRESASSGMRGISYFDRRRPELYCR